MKRLNLRRSRASTTHAKNQSDLPASVPTPADDVSRFSEVVPSKERWILRSTRSASSDPVVRLFCLPYAGGGASIFKNWQANLSSHIDVCPISLPGREMRIGQRPIAEIDRMLDALTDVVGGESHRPYALFGHSMGGLLAYELTRRLSDAGCPGPALLCVSARQAPDLPGAAELLAVNELDDDQFYSMLGKLNERTAQLLADASLRALLLPTLRADFELCAAWQPHSSPPLDVPILAFSGSADTSVSSASIAQWERHTTRRFVHHRLDGDHFFINSCTRDICEAVWAELDAAMEGAIRRDIASGSCGCGF